MPSSRWRTRFNLEEYCDGIPEKGKIFIGSWASGFGRNYSQHLYFLLHTCELVYALDEGESLSSLKLRIDPGKCRAFPPYVNNNEAATEWLNHIHGVGRHTFITPEVMFSCSGLVNKVRRKLNSRVEAMRKRLPEGVVNAMDVLDREVGEMHEERSMIVDEYNQACRLQDIDPRHAEQELEMYLKSDIPAAEFIAPVGVCHTFKSRLYELPTFDPSWWNSG